MVQVDVDDIHHVRSSLRSLLDKYQFLRLAVVVEEGSLSPFVTPRDLENGELDFDRQTLLPLKENLKYIFFHLYRVRPAMINPEILASGRIPLSEVVTGSSLWTIPLFKDGNLVCKITIFTQLLTLADQSEQVGYYAPTFTSPLKEAAINIRRVTRPACKICQSVAFHVFSFPLRTGFIFASSINNLLHSLFSSSPGFQD